MMGLHNLPEPLASSRALHIRTRAEATQEVRAAAGRDNHTIYALCGVLMERIGSHDLEDVILSIRQIYDATGDEHWEAARQIGKFSRDICDEYGIH